MANVKGTTESFVAKARSIHGAKFDYSCTVYAGCAQKLVVVCPTHGEVHILPHNHLKGDGGCSGCKREKIRAARSLTTEDFLRRAAEIHKGRYTYVVEGKIKSNERVKAVCPEHGEFEQFVSAHLRGAGCRKCASARASKAYTESTEHFVRRAVSVHGGKYDYTQVTYTGMRHRVQVVCPTHGEFEVTAGNHVLGHGCPTCAKKASAGEDEIATYIEGLGVSVKRRDRSILAPKEVDILAPDLGVAVEYHGLFWHAEDRVGDMHRTKWEMAQAAGIRLIQVFEDEWRDRRDVVKARLAAAFGMARRLAARKCTVVKLDTTQRVAFFATHHLQGDVAASECYGLLHNGTVVAAMSFGRARWEPEAWELLRFATDGVVVGAASKLYHAFECNVAPGKAVSYCDLRWGTGAVYHALGFRMVGITPPDYFWVSRSGQRIARYQLQKHKLAKHPLTASAFNPDFSETEICTAAGLYKVKGVGHQKWVKTLDK